MTPPSAPGPAPGGTGLLVPVTAALLAHQRLADAADQLRRKVTSTQYQPDFGSFTVPVSPHPVERRVLALVEAGRAAMAGGPVATVPRALPGSGIGSYTLLGALGFEIPGFAALLAPGGDWVATALRRGTPDPDRSLVTVRSTELPLALARLGTAAAGGDARTTAAVRAFGTGMLAAVAAGVTVGPQLRDLLGRDTHRDWQRHSPSGGAAALERHLRARFLGGGGVSTLSAWLPAAADVPAPVWDAYLAALGEVYRLPDGRVPGFPAFEAGFRAGDPLTAVRLRNAYGLVLDDVRSANWSARTWWLALSPVLLAPSLGLLLGRALRHGGAFFAGDDAPGPDERSVFEMLTAALAIGSITPLLYSMLLWGSVDEHTGVFVAALLMGIGRAAVTVPLLLGTGDDDPGAGLRWLGLGALAANDVTAAVLAARSRTTNSGNATVLGLQTLPLLTAGVALGGAALLRVTGLRDGWKFWTGWSVLTLGAWLGGGIPLACALASGGGWRSWFLRADRREFPIVGAVAATATLPEEPVAAARVFDASTLWPDPAVPPPADLSATTYPSGMRGLVKVWWTKPTGTLQVRHDGDVVALRVDGGAETVVRLPAGTTATALATLLHGQLGGGVAAAAVDVPAPPARPALDPVLPWPHTLADPGDAGPAAAAAAARGTFEPAGTSADTALVLRHAPRIELATAAGLVPDAPDAFPVIPTAALGDLEATGLGAAADLAALLVMAAAPSLGTVTVADGLLALRDPVLKEVVQVFRRWNLDERRLEEWQQLVSGGAPADGDPPVTPDPLLRARPARYPGPQLAGRELATAMGWIPLWRAWLRMAADPAADAGAALAMPYTPLVRLPDGAVRRPTNGQLTAGLQFLLDVAATP